MAEEQQEGDVQMHLLDHLDELRRRVVYIVLGLLAGMVLSGIFVTEVMDLILLRPAAEAGMVLQNLRPFGQPMLYFKVVFVVGIIVSFPFSIYQLWLFVAPGLYQNEKKWAGRITFLTSLCFLLGIAFAYWVMIPQMLDFAKGFGSSQIANNLDINEYFGFLSTTVLGAGLTFEMPMISYVLSSFGILGAATMARFRRHSVVVVLIIAAIITPSPDPVNQLVFAIPLYVLYEISILVARAVEKGKAREVAASGAE